MSDMPVEPAGIEARIGAVLGARVVSTERMTRGYTPALRLRVRLDDGRRCFAKIGTNRNTRNWLRIEHGNYLRLTGDFMPALLGWHDDPQHPLLIIEDLGEAQWPPPWSARQIALLRDTLERVWSQPADGLIAAEHADAMGGICGGWKQVAADPAPFLSLGLAGPGWLEKHLPVLTSFDEPALLRGDDLLHCDLRSDNLCFAGERVVIIDWNGVCRGNRRFDFAGLLSSLAAEGGPAPDALMPDAGPYAALLSGYFAARAGLPVIPEAPRVREIQRIQLEQALPWVCRALGLAPA